MKVEWERDWGKPTNESESRKLRNHTFELLRKYACEHYPILRKIKEREYEVERLARDFIARETDVPEGDRWLQSPTLESAHREICEEQRDQSEHAKIFRAAMEWSKKRDEIDGLKQKAQRVLYSYSRIDPHDYTEEYAARATLESTIRDVMVYADRIWESNDEWGRDYEFRENLENFLHDIASHRCKLREELLPDDEFYHNVGRYLKNPLWHSRVITNFLLVNLIDTSLFDLERGCHFGLFPEYLGDQLGGPASYFIPFFNSTFPGLSPKGKKMREKWRFKNLMIGSGLIYIWVGSWEGEKISNLLANHDLNLPSWVFTMIGYIGIGFLIHPIYSLLFQFINKKRMRYNRLAKVARELVVMRFEIDSGNYHAETLIERLKKLEKQDIMIHSLIYALLELQRR